MFSVPREDAEVDIGDISCKQEDEELEFTREELAEALTEIKKGAASGPDGIPADLLRSCAEAVSGPLHLMWKRSLQEGRVPETYKNSIIVPLYKKGSRAKAENYRPVSLTDHVGKAFERILRKRLVNYFESNGLFLDIQHGFRKRRSTLTQLIQHFDEVYENCLDNADTGAIHTSKI